MTDWDLVRRRVEHVVVLMLENRSFDHVLGYLDHPSPDYERLSATDTFSNLENPADPTSPRWMATADGRAYSPVDPDHSHAAVMLQLGLSGRNAAPNSGFVHSYLQKAGLARVIEARKVPFELGSVVMRCLSETETPALSRLAREFAVCTRWFSSVPGETWPNRNFVHAATSDNTVNIELGVYTDPTIFELLDRPSTSDAERARAWRIYYDGPSQAMAFRNLWAGDRIHNWAPLSQFKNDAANGKLARYSFLEPNHNSPGARLLDPLSCSQHAGNNSIPISHYLAGAAGYGADFRRGDALIAHVYEALRGNEALFGKTLLLITYDEHGGWYDHVQPPTAVPPGDRRDRGFLRSVIGLFAKRGRVTFDFKRLGGRVPAVVVSPWIKAGTLDRRTFEHASVPRTVRGLFLPGAAPITARDAAAAPFAHLVEQLDAPRTGDALPDLQDLTVAQADFADVQAEDALVPPDEFQSALDALALIVGDHLDQPIDALAQQPVLPTRLVDTTQPAPSTADMAASAISRFREFAS